MDFFISPAFAEGGQVGSGGFEKIIFPVALLVLLGGKTFKINSERALARELNT